MTTLTSLIELISQPAQHVAIVGFVWSLILAAVLSSFLGHIYATYGRSLSDRRSLASHFMLISVTTVFIIAVVKSSIALSLGLVGALSIVRFRTAIKEPEELAYLFLSVAIGLGLGADQTVATLVTFVFVATVLILRGRRRSRDERAHVFFSIQGKPTADAPFAKILEVVHECCDSADLKRYDESEGEFEAMFVTDFADARRMLKCGEKVRALNSSIALKVLDSRA